MAIKSKLGADVRQFFDNLQSGRVNHAKDWEDLKNYLRPSSQGFYTKGAKGSVDRNRVHDSTPERASEDLASSMMSMLASPATDWFGLRVTDEDTARSLEVKKYFSLCKSKIHEHLSLRPVNFYNTISSTFDDIVVFGQGAASMFRDETKKLARFAPRPLQEIFVQRNVYGEVDACYRKCLYSPRQLLSQFGESLTSELSKEDLRIIESKIKNSPNEEIVVIHAVFPRAERNIRSAVATEKKYASIYVWYEKSKVLEESGFDYFPYMAPVWKLPSGEDYGRGPGHRALPDIKTLNEMVKTNLAAANVIVTPPMTAPWGLMVDDTIDLSPLAINYTDLSNASFGAQGMTKPEPLNIIGNLPIGIEMEDRRKNGIIASFYGDLLQEVRSAEMSATEYNNRDNARVRKLTGPFARIEQDCLGLAVEFVYESLVSFGELEVPEELKGEKVEIYFTGALLQAYKALKVQVLERAMSSLAQMSGIPPQVMSSFDDQLLPAYIMEGYGAELEIMRNPEEAKKINASQQASQQDQIDAQALKDSAQGAKSLAEANRLNRGL